jgi:CheY-like chemotaxis protein
MSKGMNILLIEDNQGDSYMITETFRKIYPEDRVRTVEDGLQALSILQDDSNVDLIILDLNLPKKHGLEILTELRQEEKFKDLTVVVLTTSQWKFDHEAASLLEADASFTKPRQSQEFPDLIKAIRDVRNKNQKGVQ